MKRAIHPYKGLTSDVGRDTIGKGFYIDALDIRITTDTGESQGCVINIRGNKKYFSLPTADSEIGVTGTMEIIGATSIRNEIIFFTADDAGENGWIYKLEYEDTTQTIIGTPIVIYKSDALNFSKEHPIDAVGRFESDCIKRIYWSDYEDYWRSINIEDPDLLDTPVGLIDAFPNMKYTQPILTNVLTGGSLLSGQHQYAYRLITVDGKETLISPPGIMTHTTVDSESEIRTSDYNGNAPAQNTQKAHEVTIDTSAYGDFEKIELINILHEDYTGTPQVFSVETKNIAGASEVIFIHTGNEESITELDLFEYTVKQYPFKTWKTADAKDSSLIIANIKGSQFDVQAILEELGESFEARTGRYDSTQVLPHALTGTPEQIDEARLKNAFNVDDSTSTTNDGYNMDAHWDVNWHTSKQYKYQGNGTTLGGNGPNISYKFNLQAFAIDGNPDPGFANLANVPLNPHNLNDGYGFYPNLAFDSLASPYKSGLVRGYKRGETYRFGIVFYNKKGEASFVEYIGDIKFPDISEETDEETIPGSGINFFPVSREVSRTAQTIITNAYALGIEFDIDFSTCPNFLAEIESYQIVRVKREISESRRLCSGIMRVASKFGVYSNREEKDIDGGYDMRAPGDATNILHLGLWSKDNETEEGGIASKYGVNGNFYTINNELNIALGAEGEHDIMGTFLSFYSPDISYNFPEIRDGIVQNSMLLITGRYKDYYSSTTGSFVNLNFDNNNAQDSASWYGVTNFDTSPSGSDLENLGKQVKDMRRHLRTTAQVDKVSTNGSYPLPNQIGVEYIKQLNTFSIVDFGDGTDNNNLEPLAYNLGPYTGYDDAGDNPEEWFFRNFYIYLDRVNVGVNDLQALSAIPASEGGKSDKCGIAKGATGLTGTIKTPVNDPYTQTPLSIVSGKNHFRSGVSIASASNNFVKPKYEVGESFPNADKISTPIIDILVPRLEVYGGYNENALDSNTFMPASPILDKVEVNPIVFGGDTFITSYTFQDMCAWIQQSWFDDGGLNGGSGESYQRWDSNYTINSVLFMETRANVELAWGATIKTGVQNTAPGGPSGIEATQWRQETGNTATVHAKSLNMYRGVYNTAYSIESDDINFFVKPSNFDTNCSINDIRAYISDVKINSEQIDSWTKFGINNFYDIDDYGPINKILNWRDDVYYFQDKAIGKYSINPRAITSTDDGIPTELGSAEGFQDHTYLSTKHGAIHQWAVEDTESGIFMFDGIHKKIFKVSDKGNAPLSEMKAIHGLLKNFNGDISLRKENGGDNPILNKGVHVTRDRINNEVIFTFLGTWSASELEANTLYSAGEIVEYNGVFYQVVNTYTSLNVKDIDLLLIELQNNSAEGEPRLPSNSVTLVFDEIADQFSTKFSATPPVWIENGDLLLSADPNNRDQIYQHNKGNWGEFYGNKEEMSITLVLNENADINKILRTFEFNSIVRDNEKNIEREETITAFKIKTEYQDTGKIAFSEGRLKRRFDKWRANIPQVENERGRKTRLRSTYFELSLYFDNEINREIILDRIMYYYDVQIF